ncbi:MAG: OPT/YSL family transporter, partial [Gemmatimonadota bacterium]|nr:OPT/YSL family transporter [Gemmatimonadota bacterium]
MSDFPQDQVTRRGREHPSIFEPATLLLGLLMAVLGGVIGIQLLTRVGITPNSSVIGAVVAMTLARIPLAVLRPFGSLERQNLLQTVISGATFGGANALLLPIGIPWLLGRPDLVLPMFLGAFAGLVIDATILYRIFDSPAYPASGLWPSGVATAEVLIAGDQGGRRAGLLLAGGSVGGIGQLFGIPMDVFGVCWIGNAYALSMFALGLLLRGYMPALIGVDLSEIYMPHGLMIGAGAVALIQVVMIVRGNLSGSTGAEGSRPSSTNRVLVIGFMAFALAAAGLLFSGGAASEMSVGM